MATGASPVPAAAATTVAAPELMRDSVLDRLLPALARAFEPPLRSSSSRIGEDTSGRVDSGTCMLPYSSFFDVVRARLSVSAGGGKLTGASDKGASSVLALPVFMLLEVSGGGAGEGAGEAVATDASCMGSLGSLGS